jgi:glutamate racemase
MKIGIFDSGVGGLIIARAIRKLMPEYDYVYLGDTKRVPYGNRSHETVYEFSCQGIDYLFTQEDCALVVIACNTASARALRKIQQEYLPKYWPNKKVLGVLIPTAEECVKYEKVGIIGTVGTINSNTFLDEIKKLNKKTQTFQNPAPMLVSFAEEGEGELAKPFIEKYLKPLVEKRVDAIALGCTHYPFYKKEIREFLGPKIKVLSQDEIIPEKLKEYFKRHPEIENKLSRNKTAKILVTDITKNVERLSADWFGENSKPELVKL